VFVILDNWITRLSFQFFDSQINVFPKNNNRNRDRIVQLHYNSLASMNVKSPLSSSEYISKPCFCITSLRLDNLPFSDFVVSAIINITLVTRG
jgi:hypothetical protein